MPQEVPSKSAPVPLPPPPACEKTPAIAEDDDGEISKPSGPTSMVASSEPPPKASSADGQSAELAPGR